jgi:hypothetical protein
MRGLVITKRCCPNLRRDFVSELEGRADRINSPCRYPFRSFLAWALKQFDGKRRNQLSVVDALIALRLGHARRLVSEADLETRAGALLWSSR